MKQCSDCKEIKPLSEYYSQEKNSKKKGNYTYYQPYCKKCASLRVLKWEDENRERKNARMKEWSNKPENVPKIRRNQRNYQLRGKQLEWQRKNKDKTREYQLKRQHKEHVISQDEWVNCKKYFNDECSYCGMTYEEHKKFQKQDLHKDHVDHQGSNDISNCVPACRSCNSSKGTHRLEDWFNPDNERFTEERFERINNWLEKDYKIMLAF